VIRDCRQLELCENEDELETRRLAIKQFEEKYCEEEGNLTAVLSDWFHDFPEQIRLEMAEQICASSLEGTTQDNPAYKDAGTSQSIKALERVATLSDKLMQTLDGLPVNARKQVFRELLECLRGSNESPKALFDRLEADLSQIHNIVKLARDRLQFLPEEPGASGRRKNNRAFQVTCAAVSVFEETKGAPATLVVDGKPYGEFFDFVTDLFKALKINANVQHYIKMVKEKKTKKNRLVFSINTRLCLGAIADIVVVSK
jgi:hypothetical protein